MPNIIKLTNKKKAKEVDEWNLIKTLLQELNQIIAKQKTLTLTDDAIKKLKGEKGDSPVKGKDYFDGKNGKDGKNGRNPLIISDSPPKNPKKGDLWYQG